LTISNLYCRRKPAHRRLVIDRRIFRVRGAIQIRSICAVQGCEEKMLKSMCKLGLRLSGPVWNISGVAPRTGVWQAGLWQPARQMESRNGRNNWFGVGLQVYRVLDAFLAQSSSIFSFHFGRFLRLRAFSIVSGMSSIKRCLSTGLSRNASGLKYSKSGHCL
jgi:hypothetical protein